MDFIDDEAEASSDDDVLVPSSQTEDNPRPRKRRRRTPRLDSEPDTGDEYDLPQNLDEGDGKENHRSKYDDHIYVPKNDERHPDTFVTQLTQQFSSPSRIRGPRWMKPQNPPPSSSPSAEPQGELAYISPNQPVQSTVPTTTHLITDFDDDEDDIALLEAFDSAVNALPTNSGSHHSGDRSILDGSTVPRSSLQKSTSFRQTTLHGMHTTQQAHLMTQTQSRAHNWPLVNKNETPTHHKINRDAMTTWVYPTNLGRIRDYQYNIVHKGLFHNLLVALPTGLGKTFIAATIMLNWFRWTESAQIVFVAPTKPLVSQQIDACFNIVGIPRSQTTMLTGEVSPAVRAEEWQEKRVFFMTPQTLINDLKNGMCDPKKIVLVVVDEAHKATGNYAYVEVVKFLRRFNSSFRILALTATPGATVEAVQKVIDGLGVSRVEIRTEDSLDIRDFVHSRNVETQIFDNSDEMTMSLELFSSAVQPLMNKLNSQNAYWGKDPEKITLYGLKVAWDQWKASEAGRRAHFGLKGMISALFSALMSLAHNLELLKYHGIGPFYHKMRVFADEAASGGKYAKQVAEDENFKKLMNRLRIWVNNPDFIGHPKLSYLKTVVLNHFMDAGEGQANDGADGHSNTRIMIFAHYRDSAEEIVRVLSRHGPIIRPRIFVGQSGTKGSEGMDQKTQLDVIKKFKAGTYNTIVATSIGEEGLDIGEVDLIVCYDCSKSPIRMLQRMGRTGRKRAGNIVLLLMRGKEENDYMHAKDNYKRIQELIESGKDFEFHEDLSPRIVPREIVPAVDKRLVDIPIENTQGGSLEPKQRKSRNSKKPAKKFHMPDGVETGFTFLGMGKKSQGRSLETQNPMPKIDRDLAALPPLGDVILSEAEARQLDERYVRLAGNDDEYIQNVRFDAFPEEQQRLGRTTTVEHSRATKSLVKAFKAMRDPYQNWDRPWEYDEIEDGNNDKPRKGHANAAPSRQAKPRPQKRPRRRADAQSSDHGPEPPDPYDDNDSFIDDREIFSSDQLEPNLDRSNDMVPDEPSSSTRHAADVSLGKEVAKRFYVSQQSVDYDELDEDLPDLQTIVATTASTTMTSKSGTAKSTEAATARLDMSLIKDSNRRRARRVLDSDSDDDDDDE